MTTATQHAAARKSAETRRETKETPKVLDGVTEATASKRGRRPAGENPIEIAETLGIDFFANAFGTATDEEIRAAAPRIGRTDIQIMFDTKVAEMYGKWVAAGKPTEWAKMPLGRVYSTPDKVKGVQALITKAAGFLGYGVRLGNPVQTKDGRIAVLFAVRDKIEGRGRKPAASAE